MFWAARSPDLTPLVVFLWEYMKIEVDKTNVNDIGEFKERIKQEMKTTKKKETLENVFGGLVKSLKFCIDVNGAAFEQ